MSQNIGDFLDGAESAQAGDAGNSASVSDGATDTDTVSTADSASAAAEFVAAETYDKNYVEKLRKEAAGYRTRAKSFEDAFDGYTDEDRETLLSVARQLRTDPKSAAQEMASAAEAILKQFAETPPVVEDGTDDGEQYMTKAEYTRIRREEAISHQEKLIEAEARELGYTVDAKDVDFQLLMNVARQTKTGNLKEAHGIIEARNQAIIDKFVAGRTKDAESAPKVPGTDGFIPGTAQPIRTFKDSRAALENFINANRGNM